MTMAEPITWTGNQDDWFALQEAVENNCTCDKQHPEHPRCAACRMLTDQAALNHLEFALKLKAKLTTEEDSAV